MKNRAIIIGDVMLDHYIKGSANRLSPEAPVPVVLVEKEFSVLGGAANVANNLSKLQVPAVLFGAIGQDDAGQRLINMLTKADIVPILYKNHQPTIVKTRIVSGSQQIVRIDKEEKFEEYDSSLKLLNSNKSYLPDSLIIVSDYGKGFCSPTLLQNIITQYDSKVLVDPKGKDWDKYRGAWLVKPNVKELGDIIGESIPNTDEAIVQYGRKVLEQFDFQNLLITRSEKGMTLITKDEVQHFKAEAKEVYDISGAGDTVIAALTYGLLQQQSLKDAVALANKAASYVISKPYTYAISKEELNEL